MAFAKSNFRAVNRFDTSSDDSDNFDEFLKSLRTPKVESPQHEDDLSDFIASDSSIIYCDSSDEEDDKNDGIGFHFRVTNELNNLSLNERSPLKSIPTDENFSPVFHSPDILKSRVAVGKENSNLSCGKSKIKRQIKTKIVFSSSDSDSDCVLITNETSPVLNKESTPPSVNTLKKNSVKTYNENIPAPAINSKASKIEGNIETYTSLLDRLKPDINVSSVRGKRGGSLKLQTPKKNSIPEFDCKTEKINHTSSKFKQGSDDGLPNSLPSKCSFGKQFKSQRELLSSMLYKHFNEHVFDNKLDENMVVEWSKRLTKTAGITKCKRKRTTKFEGGKQIVETEYSSSITLSEKVIDNLQRLRDTLIHEMCHAAVWVINNINEGHGPYWKWWAKTATTKFPAMPVIKRCHSYDITYKYYYKCTICKQTIGRHSKSINIQKTVCGICKGKLILLENGNDPNTPAKIRTPNKFAMFVKENYNTYKEREQYATNVRPKHGDVMKILSEEFKKIKV